MLFDDEEQLEVRHVISLAHHNVSIYSGGDETPEGELFIKRNALCLSRKTGVGELTPDGKASKPFYLFSDLCSEKEDFYFAMLRNQERKPDADDNPPIPLQYDVKDIITLVQKLHSSEEHLQTRWINAIIGRIFLALYKTSEVENFIKSKITKKISRVKTPSFLSRIVLKHIDLGEAAPVITNPRLKDLTVDGELSVESDVRYSGNFRIEVAATARIDLGTRFKAREVNLLLAVVVKRVEGHAMIRIKPPPSNRIWLTFTTMPKIDMTIEPIVSSRQITYTLILRQIENRIKEVVAESLVMPNSDDIPFFIPQNKHWRGGIWADERVAHHSEDPETVAAQEGDVDEVAHLETEHNDAIAGLPEFEKSMSMPVVDASPPSGIFARRAAKSALNLQNPKATGSSTSVESRASVPEKAPRALRSGSFASASSPVVSTDGTHADAFKNSTPPEHSHAMAAIAALSQTNSPSHTPVGSPSGPPSRMEMAGSQSSESSRDSVSSEKDIDHDLTPQPSLNSSDITSNPASGSFPPSPASISTASFKSETPSARSFGFGRNPRRENSTSTSSSGKSSTAEPNKRLILGAVTNAAATAKKWGWNAIQRNQDQRMDGSSEPAEPSPPLVMGRGRPLPPPGTPLPPPDRRTKTAPIPVPKRKPIPPPSLPQRPKEPGNESNGLGERYPLPPPPLPKRRSREETVSDATDDGLFVVAAPASDSLPGTPMSENPPEHAPVYMQPWVDDVDEEEDEVQKTPQPAAFPEPPSPKSPSTPNPPRLPQRRPPHRGLSTSPEEDGPQLPSWVAAQEEEQRAKSAWVDDDAGLQ
jgi:hypothetical protein